VTDFKKMHVENLKLKINVIMDTVNLIFIIIFL